MRIGDLGHLRVGTVKFVDELGVAIAAADPRARIVARRALRGGLSNTMTVVDVRVDGAAARWVVRQRRETFDDLDRIGDEAAVLQRLARAGLPVPRIVHAGGNVIVLEYVDATARLEVDFGGIAAPSLASMLAAIHGIDIGLSLQRNADYFRWRIDAEPEVMDLAMREPEIRGALRGVALPDPPGFVHGDFWPGNVLWSGDRIAAVIDWESAALGDPLADVACTRLDLLFVYGRDAMDEFTECYRVLRPFHDDDLAIWSLIAALRPCGQLDSWAASMHEYGRTDVTEPALRARHAEFTAAALAAIR